MALWPFKRRGTKSTVDSEPRHEENPAPSHVGPQPSLKSNKRSRKKRNATQSRQDSHAQVKQLDAITPLSPMDATFARPRTSNSHRSVEDITALPRTRQLRTSPHLRPATKNDADIPYNFHLYSSSRLHTPRPETTENRPQSKQRNKLSRSPSKRKKVPVNELPMKLSKKYRKDRDAVREEDLRVMSAPTNVPRQPGRQDSGVLRRDSKKLREGLNRNFERPVSHISLPQPDSGPSSRHGIIDGRSYRISVLDVLAPRPIVRPTQQPYSMLTIGWSSPPSRSSSYKRTVSSGKQPLKSTRLTRVEDLADDMDSTDLRVIMDRDKRSKEKKRTRDAERLKRQLERRAERDRLRQEAAEAGVQVAPAESGRDTDAKKPKKELSEEERTARRKRSRRKREKEAAAKAASEKEGTAAKTTDDANHQDPFRDPDSSPRSKTDNRRSPPAPLRIPPGRPEMGEVDVAKPSTPPARDSRPTADADPFEDNNDTESIPQFPVFGSGSEIDETPLPSPISSSYPIKNKLAPHLSAPAETYQPPTLAPSDTPSTTALPAVPSSPERRKRRPSLLFSFFRRGDKRKSRANSSSEAEPELGTSFVNLSRDQMRGDLPPIPGSRASAQPGVMSSSSRTETPVRSQSKFHENLPELDTARSRTNRPPSPPASRVTSSLSQQSYPEVIRGAMITPTSHHRISEQSAYAANGQGADADKDGKSPVRQAHPFTQSLASIDSEGSWLTGKPVKRVTSNRSSALKGPGSKSDPASQRNSNSHADSRGSDRNSFSDDGTETGARDESESSTPTGVPGEKGNFIVRNHRGSNSGQTAPIADHKATYEAIGPSKGGLNSKLEKKEGQMKVYGQVARQPNIKHGLRVKSSEGLLKEMLNARREGGDYELDSDIESPVTEKGDTRHDSSIPNIEDLALEGDSDNDDLPTLQRATSVKTGKLLEADAKMIDVSKRSSRDISGTTTPQPQPQPQPQLQPQPTN
jgi:hypothetical protein